MDSLFFRVEHDLLRSDSFKTLSGSAIKVYLTIGSYADFGTGWAYPSIRTIAKQAGLSRQTVLEAVEELTRVGLVATSKSAGRSNAYRILRGAPDRPRKTRSTKPTPSTLTVPDFFQVDDSTGPESFQVGRSAGPDSGPPAAFESGPRGQSRRPKGEPGTNPTQQQPSIPIPGTPFRVTAEGQLLVTVDIGELLREHGLSPTLAQQLATERGPETVAKVLLNATYLKSQGKLQNAPGYIRAGLESGYELLPQVANRLESRRRELEQHLRAVDGRTDRERRQHKQRDEEEAIRLVLEQLSTADLDALVRQAVASLPPPLTRRNPSLSNPFVRARVYELAGGEPIVETDD